MTDALFEHRQDIGTRIIGQQIFERDEAALEFAFSGGLRQFFHFDGLIERKFADGGAADFGEMRATTEFLAHVVSERANVGAGGALDGETRARAIDFKETIFEKLDGDGFEFDGLVFAGEFVGGTALHFFGGEGGRHLLEAAEGFGGEAFKEITIERWRGVGALGGAFGVVGVSGVAETERSGVALASSGVEAYEAGGFAEKENEDAGGKRVERTEMADLAKARQMADGVDDVVGSAALRFVDDERAVEWGGLGLAWHEKVITYKLSVFQFGRRGDRGGDDE